MTAGGPRRAVVHVLVIVGLVALATTLPAGRSGVARAGGDDDWLTWLNYYRSIGSLPAVQHDPSYDAGPTAHAEYLIELDQTGLCPAYPHCEAIPPGSELGDEGARNVILRSGDPGLTGREVVEGLIAAPFHALAMLRPGLQRVGFGLVHDATKDPWQSAGVINVSTDPSATDESQPYIWPANGSSTPLVAYSGNETPDPLVATSCAALHFPSVSGTKAAGLPIIVRGIDTGDVHATLTDTTTGQSLAACVATSHDYPAESAASAILAYDRVALVIPEAVLAVGHRFTVVLTGSATMTSTFATIEPLGASTGATPPSSTIPGVVPPTVPVALPEVPPAPPSPVGTSDVALVVAFAGLLAILGAPLSRRWSAWEPDRARLTALIGVATTWIASVYLPWGSARIGTTRHSWRGIDMPVIGVVALVVAVVTAVVAVVSITRDRETGRPIRLLLGGVATVAFGFIAVVEAVGSLIPTSFIPTSFRRASFDFSSGTGAWMAGVAAVAGIVVSVAPDRWMDGLIRETPLSARSVAPVGCVVGASLLIFGRYLPWVHASVANGNVQVEGWAIPYLGQWSLAMVFVLLIGLATVPSRFEIGGLVLTGVGLLGLVMPAAVFASTAGLLLKSHIAKDAFAEATSRFTDVHPDISLGAGPWVTYVGGLAVACSLAYGSWARRRV